MKIYAECPHVCVQACTYVCTWCMPVNVCLCVCACDGTVLYRRAEPEGFDESVNLRCLNLEAYWLNPICLSVCLSLSHTITHNTNTHSYALSSSANLMYCTNGACCACTHDLAQAEKDTRLDNLIWHELTGASVVLATQTPQNKERKKKRQIK